MSHVIPVLSLRELAEPQGLQKLAAACREWGFFQLMDHGIGASHRARLFTAAREFFALPLAQKQVIERTQSNPWGYYDQELTKNRRDWKQIWDYGPAATAGPATNAEPQWPDLPGFGEVMREHYLGVTQLAHRLLEHLANAMDAPALALTREFNDHSSFLRLNFYPPCPTPAAANDDLLTQDTTSGDLGISHHTDAGALTVLLQDAQPGLQVWHEERWITVMPLESACVINIGDIVQVWSNDEFKAPLHRVLANAQQPRYSAAFFFNPSYATNYAPLPSKVSAAHPPRYRRINWGEFRNARSSGDFADYGQEVQISHYAMDD